ncbi:MAG TPA: GerMN domain-containing protein [Candidatus Mediterraneibacter excrementipullorum]|nr:GerMN domain-containing protein [Candidatus Mediterraneibacter excrementipullorum]
MKKYWRFLICAIMVLCMSLFSITGCGKAGKEDTDKKNTEERAAEAVESPNEEETGNQSDQPVTSDEPVDDTAEGRIITVYYVDAQTAEIVSESVEIHDEYDIWDALKENGILTEDCELLSLTVNEAEKKIDLDFNSAVGDRVRSMGTTGETEIVGCIINTYLEAYGCEGIRLTEEGRTFETSHGADLDGYSGKVTF